MTTTSKRPLPVIEADIRVTRLGREVCQSVVDAALAARHKLLRDGWPTAHALCEALDGVAERWAAHTEQQRRDLLALEAERRRDSGAVTS